jgi:hypothetical protein
LFDTAKFDSRGPSSFFWRHACANVFLGQNFQLGVNFLVEVCIHTAR